MKNQRKFTKYLCGMKHSRNACLLKGKEKKTLYFIQLSQFSFHFVYIEGFQRTRIDFSVKIKLMPEKKKKKKKKKKKLLLGSLIFE